MQTFDKYMASLPMKEHAKVMRVLQDEVPLSRNMIYAVRNGKYQLSITKAMKVYEVLEKVVDPRSLTKPEVWDQLDAYYKDDSKPKVRRKVARKA